METCDVFLHSTYWQRHIIGRMTHNTAETWAWHVNMERCCVFSCVKCLVLLQLTSNVVGWNSEDLELFDLVEEVNENFYDVLGVTQVSREVSCCLVSSM